MRCSDTFHSAENCPEGGHEPEAQALSSPAELARWVEVNHGDHPEWVDELRALLPRGDSGWRTGPPPDHGYYLGAWRHGDRWVVSELWFNPDSTGSKWWPTRRYLGERDKTHQTVPVVAWMPVPPYDGPGA